MKAQLQQTASSMKTKNHHCKMFGLEQYFILQPFQQHASSEQRHNSTVENKKSCKKFKIVFDDAKYIFISFSFCWHQKPALISPSEYSVRLAEVSLVLWPIKWTQRRSIQQRTRRLLFGWNKRIKEISYFFVVVDKKVPPVEATLDRSYSPVSFQGPSILSLCGRVDIVKL